VNNANARPTIRRTANSAHAHGPRRRQSRWALWALVFPLFFLAIISMGVYFMFHRKMEFFRPGHESGLPDSTVQRTVALRTDDPSWGVFPR